MSHSILFNTVVDQNTLDAKDAHEMYKTNLWQHLVDVKKCSFRNAFTSAAKRKIDADLQVSLCRSMDGLVLSKKGVADLNLSFKKLRLGDDTACSLQ